MAKKRGRPPGNSTVAVAAETVGSTLGGLMSRVDSWMKQRDQLAAELRAMADNIASGVVNVAGSIRQAGTAAVATVTGTRKRRTMSAEARAKIAAAQRARWAKQKGEASSTAKPAKTAKKAKRGRTAKKAGDHVGNG